MKNLAHPIDIGIFTVFLAVNLIVGLMYGRRVKNLFDYALGGKNFSTATLTATIVATWTSGWILALILEKVYTEGLYFILAIMGDAFALLFIGRILAARSGNFLNNVSVAETMGSLYGKAVQVITAIAGIAKAVGIVAVQFKVSAKLLSIFFSLQGNQATFLTAGIVILYSTFGGIRAVTFTDFIQFITFGTFVPVLALVIWNSVQDSSKVAEVLTASPLFSFQEIGSSPTKIGGCISLMLFFALSGVEPALFQRISMARHVEQAKRAFTYAFGLYTFIILFMIWLAVLIRADKPGLQPSTLINYVINHYAYTGLRGCVAAGIMAMVMSTADSYINTAAVLFTNDIVGTLKPARKNSIVVARAFALVLGVLALWTALFMDDLLGIALLVAGLYIPMVTAPLLLVMLGFRTSKRIVLIGMIFGFTTAALWRAFMSYTKIDSVIPGMLANLVGLMGSHYLLKEPGGWQEDRVRPLSAIRQGWQKLIRAIRSFKLYPYLQRNLPTQEYFYFFFGLYTIAATYTAFYTVGDPEVSSYRSLYEGIYHSVLVATTGFLTYPIWPSTVKSKRFITFFWPLGIGAILFFVGTLLVIMSHFHTMQVMILMLNVLIAALLLHWPLAVLLSAGGIMLGVLFFKQFTGLHVLPGELGTLQFKVLYGFLLFTVFLIALCIHQQTYAKLRRRSQRLQAYQEATQEELLEALESREHLVQELTTEGLEALNIVQKHSEQLAQEITQAKTIQQLVSLQNTFKAAVQKLQSVSKYVLESVYYIKDYLRLEVSTIALEQLMETVRQEIQDKYLTSQPRLVYKNHSQHKTLQCDVAKVKQLLVNAIDYAHQQNATQHPVLVVLEDTKLGYMLTTVKEQIKKVTALQIVVTTADSLPPIQDTYMLLAEDFSVQIPQALKNFPLKYNQQIVDAHYGVTEFRYEEGSLTQIYVIPAQVREVRPKTEDLVANKLLAEQEEPRVYREEEAFLAAVKSRTQADIALVEKAVAMIKKYHGTDKRKSGEPFYLHPIAVAHILLDYTQDQEAIIAALLHDTVEDTSLSLPQLEIAFNAPVATIVAGVTKFDMNVKTHKKLNLTAHENIQQLLKVEDQRALYVKLADRLHNMQTIEGHSSLEKQKKIAEETLLFYIPLAKNLGFKTMEAALQKLVTAVMDK